MFRSALFTLHLLVSLLLCMQSVYSQSKVAVTIDDVPSMKKAHGKPKGANLLHTLDSLQIPVTIFINEGHVYNAPEVAESFKKLNEWTSRKNVSIGNHTFSHPRYSTAGLDSFKTDVMRGQAISKELALRYGKSFQYFRFPFNDLGKDSAQHAQIRAFLDQENLTITPFTVESSDWMFNSLYEDYLEKGESLKAKEIARQYVGITLHLFDFFDSLAMQQYGRNVNHIYLCHDNRLNADYLDVLIESLRRKGYHFISLDEAMTDPVYRQQDHYTKKWGVSWFYRWMEDPKNRMQYMKKEPYNKEVLDRYNQMSAEAK